MEDLCLFFLHASQPDGKQQVWERREGGFPVLEKSRPSEKYKACCSTWVINLRGLIAFNLPFWQRGKLRNIYRDKPGTEAQAEDLGCGFPPSSMLQTQQGNSPTQLGEYRSPDVQFLPAIWTPCCSAGLHASKQHRREHLTRSYDVNRHSVKWHRALARFLALKQTSMWHRNSTWTYCSPFTYLWLILELLLSTGSRKSNICKMRTDEMNGTYVNISDFNPILSSQPNANSVLTEAHLNSCVCARTTHTCF